MNIKLCSEKKIWESVLDRVSPLVDEFKLKIGKEGIDIIVVDPSNVAMVCLNISKNYFTEYLVEPGDTEIGIDINDFKIGLDVINSTDDFCLTYDTGKLRINKKTASIKLLDVTDMPDAKIPDLNLDVTVKTRVGDLKHIIDISKKVRDYILFETDKKNLLIKSENDSINLSLPTGIVSKGYDKKSKTFFSNDYLLNLLKFDNNDNIILKFSTDHPLKVEHTGNGIKTISLLAPRLENE